MRSKLWMLYKPSNRYPKRKLRTGVYYNPQEITTLSGQFKHAPWPTSLMKYVKGRHKRGCNKGTVRIQLTAKGK